MTKTKTKTKTKTGKISYMPPPLILIKSLILELLQKNNPTRQKKWWLDFFQKQWQEWFKKITCIMLMLFCAWWGFSAVRIWLGARASSVPRRAICQYYSKSPWGPPPTRDSFLCRSKNGFAAAATLPRATAASLPFALLPHPARHTPPPALTIIGTYFIHRSVWCK